MKKSSGRIRNHIFFDYFSGLAVANPGWNRSIMKHYYLTDNHKSM